MCDLCQTVYIHPINNVVDIVLFEMEKIKVARDCAVMMIVCDGIKKGGR